MAGARGQTPAAQQSFTLSVADPVLPTISGPLSGTLAIGRIASFTFWATGTPAPTLTTSGIPTGMTAVGLANSFTYGISTARLAIQGSSPAGLIFVENGDGTANIEGTPLQPSAGVPGERERQC